MLQHSFFSSLKQVCHCGRLGLGPLVWVFCCSLDPFLRLERVFKSDLLGVEWNDWLLWLAILNFLIGVSVLHAFSASNRISLVESDNFVAFWFNEAHDSQLGYSPLVAVFVLAISYSFVLWLGHTIFRFFHFANDWLQVIWRKKALPKRKRDYCSHWVCYRCLHYRQRQVWIIVCAGVLFRLFQIRIKLNPCQPPRVRIASKKLHKIWLFPKYAFWQNFFLFFGKNGFFRPWNFWF